jgi:hypothetical protein
MRQDTGHSRILRCRLQWVSRHHLLRNPRSKRQHCASTLISSVVWFKTIAGISGCVGAAQHKGRSRTSPSPLRRADYRRVAPVTNHTALIMAQFRFHVTELASDLNSFGIQAKRGLSIEELGQDEVR